MKHKNKYIYLSCDLYSVLRSSNDMGGPDSVSSNF